MFKCPCEPTVETLAQAESDDEAGPGRQAGWWAGQCFSHSVSLSSSKRSWRPRGLGKAWQDGIGKWGSGPGGNTPLSSASALDLGLGLDLDLGFLFRSLPAVTLPPCLFPAKCHERAELAFLEASSLCGELTRDAGRRQLHNSRFSQLGCCTVGVTVCTVGVHPHHDVCQYFDTVDYVLWMEAAAPVQHRLKRDVIGIKNIG